MRARYLTMSLFVLLAAWMGMTTMAVAASTSWGPTGLLNIPTADVNPVQRLDLGLHQERSHAALTATYGVLDALEAGIGVHGLNKDTKLSANVKVALTEETAQTPAVAIGVSGVDSNTYYMVASKYLGGLGVRGHLGIGKGRVNGLFAGVSKVLNPVTVSTSERRMHTPMTTLMGEWDGSALNVGADFAFSSGFSVRLMLEDMDSFSFGLQLRSRI